MRKEADDSGPLTELEHWKRMSAKFNFIIEQIKGPSCKCVINVLNIAHSKQLKVILHSFQLYLDLFKAGLCSQGACVVS